MTQRGLLAAAASAALMLLSSTAGMAEGAGRYSVAGTNTKEKTNYQGTVTITKTGNLTWQVVEVIGTDTIEGYGIGDGKVIAVSYATDLGTQLALYTVNSDGSYTGIWVGEDDKEVSAETLKPQ